MKTAESSQQLVARGARVNAFGVVARIAQPVAFGLLTRWYGPAEMGIFLLASAVFETTAALATSGIQDAVIAHVSPLESGSDQAYWVLASAVILAGGATVVGALLVAVGAWIAPGWLPQAGVGAALWLMAPALPLFSMTGIVVAATRARYVQTYDVVLQGVLRPCLVIVCGWLLSRAGAQADRLAVAYVVAHAVLAAVSLVVMARYYNLRRLAQAMRMWPVDRPLLAFAVPQNINLAVYALTHGASVLAIGTAGLPPAHVALFAAAMGVVTSLRHVRLVFTSAMAPVAATLFAQGRRDALQDVMTRSVRWSLMMALPVAAVMLVFRNPLLRLFHPSYTMSWTVMALLIVGPLVNIVAGFSSNVLVMARFVRWNLFNTVVAAVSTYGLTWMFAPRMGLAGAALASAVSGVLVAGLQIGEAATLVGVVPWPWRTPGPRVVTPNTDA